MSLDELRSILAELTDAELDQVLDRRRLIATVTEDEAMWAIQEKGWNSQRGSGGGYQVIRFTKAEYGHLGPV